MKIPTIIGIIKRRILANYLADANTVQNILPAGFRPKLHKGKAVAGICLIRLEHIRPKFVPGFLGISSENAAHRIAVEWENERGDTIEGVYIPRRDTSSLVNAAAGGRLFPGEHHRAKFAVTQTGDQIEFSMVSDDRRASVKLAGKICDKLTEDSVFSSLAEASGFFEKGALGYSATKNEKNLDGLVLEIKNWCVRAFELDFIESSFYDDKEIFPPGSIEFDHALLMENIAHEWHSAPGFEVK